VSDLTTLPTAEVMEALKTEVLKHEQYQPETQHFFADGMYMRVLPRPATCLIVGKKHKKQHFYVVVKGKVTIVGEGKRQTVEAPAYFVCEPGTQRAVYAHEDSICLTVHRTDKTDLAGIDEDLVESDPESPFLPGNILKQELLK
jgi:quercetin dioxygenase-like cupin family protein